MSDIATEAKDFVAYIKAEKLEGFVPFDIQALTQAVDDDAQIPHDGRIDGNTNCFVCARCGKSIPLPLPIDVRALGHWIQYCRYEHARCKAKA